MFQVLGKFDLILTLSAMLLLSLGLTVLSSVASELMTVQIAATLIGLVMFFLFSKINYQVWQQMSKFLYPASILILLLTFIFGVTSGGAMRWIQLGPVSIQSSEFVRPFLLIVLSGVIAINGPLNLKVILKSALIVSLPAYLIFRQPDLSLTLALLAGWLGMLFSKGLSWKQLSIGIIMIVLIIPLGWNLLHDYQKNRVLNFINPGRDPLNTGYHVLQSQIAVGSGQLFGRGLGRGTQSHLRFLPESHTDFVFASWAEEFGFIGSVLTLFLYLILLSRFVYAQTIAKEQSGRLLSSGLLATLMFQIFANVGMNIGLLPVTGVTLPLFSYGGSSLVSTFVILGVINNVLMQNRNVKSLHIR